ncbi:SDR family oxidoreductase [Pelagibacterales bacterium SAG-MED09]|nr:SDR family oxidoreductase [Pelagibacterales bacterium SAG-MED09]
MKKKNILITGSEGLIGKSFRKFMEKKSKNIFCIDLKNIKRKNYFKCDITNENQVKKVIESISKKNKIDVLINNASVNPNADSKMKTFKFTDYSLEKWKKNIEVDIVGSFLVSKYALRVFQKQNYGKIINISSIYGLVGPDQNLYTSKTKKYYGYKNLEYSVAKAGLIGFTKALASFYKSSKIEIICFILGGIENKPPKKFKQKYNSKNISQRMAKVGEYNEIINFYCSDKASYVSGSCVYVDGGALSIL